MSVTRLTAFIIMALVVGSSITCKPDDEETSGGSETGSTTGGGPWTTWDSLQCADETCGPTQLCVHDEWNGATQDSDANDGDSTYCRDIPMECLNDFEACRWRTLCEYQFDDYADGHLYCSCDDLCT